MNNINSTGPSNGRKFSSPERRSPQFTEKLSLIMVFVSAMGAITVLLDPQLQFGDLLVIDGSNFSPDLKGAIIMGILIGGWTAVQKYWLDANRQSEVKSETIGRIAESGTPAVIRAMNATSSSDRRDGVERRVQPPVLAEGSAERRSGKDRRTFRRL